MALLSDLDLQGLGGLITELVLTDDGDILRETQTRTPGGGHTSSWDVAHSTKCAIVDAGSPGETMVAAQQSGMITKLALLPRGTDILGTDRLRVNGLTYHVIDLFEPETFEVVRRVLVRRSATKFEG